MSFESPSPSAKRYSVSSNCHVHIPEIHFLLPHLAVFQDLLCHFFCRAGVYLLLLGKMLLGLFDFNFLNIIFHRLKRCLDPRLLYMCPPWETSES